MRVRSTLGVLAVVVVLGACGADRESVADGPTSTGPTSTSRAEEPQARFEVAEADRATAGEAESRLNTALDRLLDRPFTFAGTAPSGLGTIATRGQVDAARQDSTTTVAMSTSQWEPAEDLPDLINLESRFVSGRGYVAVPNGPALGCWFDMADVPGAQVAEQSWIPYAVAALGTTSARGFSVDDRDVVVVDTDATNLTGIALPKAARSMFVAQEVPVAAEVTVEGGRIVGLSYELRDAVAALIEAGATVPDGIDREQFLDMVTAKVEVTFTAGASKRIEAPSQAELIDMSEADADAPMEPCPAAG